MRLKVQDLLPGTQYAFQVRVVKNGERSKWSEKYVFTTDSHNTNPSVPASVTFDSVGTSFVATWVPVTTDTSGNAVIIASYDLEFDDGAGGTRYVSVTPQTGVAAQSYTLTYSANQAMFGAAVGSPKFRVRSVSNKGLKSAWSAQVTATNPAPAAVTGFSATGVVNGVSLKWNSNTDLDLKGYHVYASTTSGFTPAAGNRVYDGVANTFIYSTSTYVQHYFVIRAYDVFNQESADASATATPVSPFLVDTTAPATPTGLAATMTTATNGLSSYVDVSWSSVADSDLAGYTVRYRKNGTTDAYDYQTIPKTDTSTRIELATIYTSWDFAVRAYDASANYSAWSGAVTATAPANAAPANVTGLVSTAGKDSITYSWNAVADLDIKNYELTFSTSPTFASGNTTFFTGSSTTLTVGGLSYGTTYYARVRAVDTAGLTSASWSSTDTETTGTITPTDGAAPSSSPTPTTLARFNAIYATWTAVTNNDPVTYEVHLGTSSGFAVSSATKVTEVSGTSALITNLPGTTTALSYGTPYYVRLVAKDRDGSAAAGTTSSSVTLSKIDSNDVTSIGANLIVPGTGFVNALVVNTGGSIQSSNYDATHGWKIAPTGIEMNDSGSTIKVDALKTGTIGGSSGAGVINIGVGTSLIFNGGYLKSSTYTGTSQASNPSGAGFYLGDDGIRIDQGIVSSSALTTGTISGTNTITLSGANAKIIGAGGNFVLSGSGLTVPNGSINAAALNIQAGAQNLVPGQFSSFELASTWYSTSATNSNATGSAWSISSTQKYDGSQSLSLSLTTTATANAFSQYNGMGKVVPVTPGSTYIVSSYVYQSGGTASDTNYMPVIVGTTTRAPSPGNTAISSINTWVRFTSTFTANAGETAVQISPRFTNPNATAFSGRTYYVDAIMVEEQMSTATTASTYGGGGITTIDGDMIRTGSIISTSNTGVGGTPLWSIPLNGSATFQNLQVRGASVVGVVGGSDGTASYIQSANYSPGSAGWKVDAAGNAEFQSGTFRGTINATSGTFSGTITSTATIQGGTLKSSTSSTDYIMFGGGFNRIAFYDNSVMTGYIASGQDVSTGRYYMSLKSGSYSIGINGTDGVGIRGPLSTDSGMTITGGVTVSGASTFNNSVNVNQFTSNNNVTAANGITADNAGAGGGFVDGTYIGGGTTTASVNNNGRIIRTSTINMKKSIEEMTREEAHSVLGLKSYTFMYKQDEYDKFEDPRRYPGFIAEQAAKAGAELWVARQHDLDRDPYTGEVKKVTRNRKGKPVAFRTADVTVAHNYLLAEIFEEMEMLRNRVKELEDRD